MTVRSIILVLGCLIGMMATQRLITIMIVMWRIGQETDGSHTEAHSAGLIVQDNGFLQDNGDYLMVGIAPR